MSAEKFSGMVERIRSQYFPRWVSGRQWQAMQTDQSAGYCDRAAQKLYIGRQTENYMLDVLIVHEIAHATTTDDHGDEWADEIRRVAIEARTAGQVDLSQRILQHLEWVESGYDYDEGHATDDMNRAVDEYPEYSCDQIIKMVAHECGFAADHFEQLFPWCRDWYSEKKHMMDRQPEPSDTVTREGNRQNE